MAGSDETLHKAVRRTQGDDIHGPNTFGWAAMLCRGYHVLQCALRYMVPGIGRTVAHRVEKYHLYSESQQNT